jgi:uncharacterized protein YbjT (DUF2867 family)
MTTLKRVLVTGGGTFLGDNIAAALLAEGAEVTLLVRPGAEDRLGGLGQKVRWWTADVWNPASLKGRARGQQLVIHTVGGVHADPAQGLTHHYLNFVSARNVANLCVSSGVPHLVFMSAARAPWNSRGYIAAKREAEVYIDRIGLKHTIIRAPLAYVRGTRRPLFWQLMSVLGGAPPVSWLIFGRIAPIPVDVLARGVARIALDPNKTKTIYYARDLRRRNRPLELRRVTPLIPPGSVDQLSKPIELMNDDEPFGWTPSVSSRDDD